MSRLTEVLAAHRARVVGGTRLVVCRCRDRDDRSARMSLSRHEAHVGEMVEEMVADEVESAIAQLEAVRTEIDPQWRSVPHDLPDTSLEAFTAGRNWMIDRLRAVLGD